MPNTNYRGYPIPEATGAQPAGAGQLRAAMAAVDLDVAQLVRGYRRLTQVRYTVSGTFVKADYPGLAAVEVEVVGGGGGSAYRQASSASQVAIAQGGAGAGYSKKWILAGDLDASTTVTIGAAGTGATSSGSSGSGGGTTYFGVSPATAHCRATGSSSAVDNVLGTNTSYNVVTPPTTRAAGIGIGGDVNLTGTEAKRGFLSSSATYGGSAAAEVSYPGIAPVYGAMATLASYIGGGDSVPGIGYGSGALGGIKIGSASANNGSDGSGGLCVVTLYVAS